MTVLLRSGAFETNSSSSHSLVYLKEPDYITEKEFREELWFKEGEPVRFAYDARDVEFGRYPFQVLATAAEKARYYVADTCCYFSDEDYLETLEKITEVIKTVCPDFPGFKPLEAEGCAHLYDCQIEEGEKYYKGEVDHQSSGMAEGFVRTYGLERYLLDKNVIVIIDGDEYCHFDHLYPLLRKDLLTFE